MTFEIQRLDEFALTYTFKAILGLSAGLAGDFFMNLAGANPYYAGLVTGVLFGVFFYGAEVSVK